MGIKRQEVAVKIGEILKDGTAKSLSEIAAAIPEKIAEAKIYFTMKDLIAQNIIDYSERRGRVKLFKLVAGADVSKAVFKQRGRAAKKPVEQSVRGPVAGPVVGQPSLPAEPGVHDAEQPPAGEPIA